jgi:hypothetical protein
MVELLRRYSSRGCIATVLLLRCCCGCIAAVLLLRCCCGCIAAVFLWQRCCCYNGVAALLLQQCYGTAVEIFGFFLASGEKMRARKRKRSEI